MTIAITKTATVATSPDDRRQRQPVPAHRHVERHAVRPGEVRRCDAEPQDGELRRREREQDAEAEQAREEDHRVRGQRSTTTSSAIAITAAATIDCGAMCVLPAEAAEDTRQHPVLAQRVREPAEARHRRRDAGEQDQRARDADDRTHHRDDAEPMWPCSASAMPISGALSHVVPSAVVPFSTGYADRPM